MEKFATYVMHAPMADPVFMAEVRKLDFPVNIPSRIFMDSCRVGGTEIYLRSFSPDPIAWCMVWLFYQSWNSGKMAPLVLGTDGYHSLEGDGVEFRSILRSCCGTFGPFYMHRSATWKVDRIPRSWFEFRDIAGGIYDTPEIKEKMKQPAVSSAMLKIMAAGYLRDIKIEGVAGMLDLLQGIEDGELTHLSIDIDSSFPRSQPEPEPSQDLEPVLDSKSEVTDDPTLSDDDLLWDDDDDEESVDTFSCFVEDRLNVRAAMFEQGMTTVEGKARLSLTDGYTTFRFKTSVDVDDEDRSKLDYLMCVIDGIDLYTVGPDVDLTSGC